MTSLPSRCRAGHVVLDISGMTCAACAGRVEGALGKVPGVARAEVNLALERADVALKGDGASPEALIEAVTRAGYGAHSRGGSASERRLAEEQREADAVATERHDLVLFALSAALTLPLVLPMVLAPFGVRIPPPSVARAGAGDAGAVRRRRALLSRCLEGAARDVRQHGRAGRARHHGGLSVQRLHGAAEGLRRRDRISISRARRR